MPHSIRTQRLLLRPPVARDARALARHCSDIAVTRMTARWPARFSEDFARARLASAAAGKVDGALFSILWQGECVGLIGLHGADPAAAWEIGRLGYMSGRAAWGRGLMTEAVRAVCRHGFSARRLGLILAEHYLDNPASGRVLEKAGFACIGEDPPVWSEARGRADPGTRYALTRERLIP